MDSAVLHIVVTVVLTLVFAVITALIWRRAQVKTVFWWIGLTLLPAGLYFLGLAPAIEGAVTTLSDWAMGVQFTPAVWAGIVLAGLSALLLLGSRLIPSESAADRRAARKEAAKQPRTASGRPAATTSGRRTPAVSSGASSASTSQPAAGTQTTAQAAGSDAEFDEGLADDAFLEWA
ncbi:MAG: hypothetical protein L0G22_07670, partial [Propionibacteriaceae bacterium]|nr:hypothetical protein [Propionibacteriaceae bacterium]